MIDFTNTHFVDETLLTRYHQDLINFLSDTYLNKSGGTMNGQINSCSILPKTTANYNLGSSDYKFKDGYFNGWLYATHFISANGNVRPSVNGQGSIGSSSYYWGNSYLTNIYSNGTLYLKPGSGKTDYNQGIRITPHSSNSWASILLGGKDLSADTGTSAKSWFIANSDGVFGFYKNGYTTSADSYINCDSSGNWSMTGSLTNNSGFIGNLTGSATYATSAGSAVSATSADSATNASNILQAYATASYNRPLLLSNITGTSTTSDVNKPTNFSNKFYANPSSGVLTATGGFGGGLRNTDTRSDNQNPQWYFTNYPSQTKTEFKNATSIGLPSNLGIYVTLMTIVPWAGNSGGYPVQLAFTNAREDNLLKVFKRTGTSNTAWSDWNSVEIALSNVKSTADNAVTNLNNINLISDSAIRSLFDDLPTFKRYGFIVTQTDNVTNPDDMVEYIYDAIGMTPAGLNSSNVFSYGSWENFCNEICKPAMVAPDCSIMYELDHTDQTKKLDGTASAYDDASQNGNMMAVFKCLYVSITEPDSTHLKVVFSDAKLDDTYQAYAFTDENGRIKDYSFLSMFNGTKDSNNKLRSLKSSSQAIHSVDGNTMRTYAQNNGSAWDFPDYSLWNHVQWLLVLISKSLDVKAKFGKGNISGGRNNPSLPGALISTGMFSGTTANETSPVKTFYVENMWGNSWNWVNGLLSYNGNYYLKLTPPYTSNSITGYENVGAKPASGSFGCIKAMGNYNGVSLPKTVSGTDYSKWYKARFYNGYGTSDSTVRTAFFGGCRAAGAYCSVFCLSLNILLSNSGWAASARVAAR